MLYTLGNITTDDIVVYETHELFLNANGGNAIYSAIGALIWYQPVHILARIGQTYPRENIEKLHRAGIATFLKEVPFRDLRSWALYEPGGIRQFVDQLSAGKIGDVSIRGEDIPGQYLGGKGYHIAPMPYDAQFSLVRRLRAAGTVISLDPDRDGLPGSAAQQATFEALPLLDFYLPSQKEATDLLGWDDPERAVRTFTNGGVPVAGVKLGEDGVLLSIRATRTVVQVPAARVAVTDPTGAGDSFCGGFLAGYLLTRDPVEAACHGVVSASYVIQHYGALSTLSADFSDSADRLEDVRSRIRVIA
ncbi:MAG: hypothetical protein IT326_01660 [Anaerolineae bacterium]|nr:hypothetical protein [Anaerolineae bacterium]